MADDKLYLTAADPPGTANRRWRCQYCQALGTLAELAAKKCTKGGTHPPPASN